MPFEFRIAGGADAAAIHELVQASFEEYRDAIPVPPRALADDVEDDRRAAAAGRVLLALDSEPAFISGAPAIGRASLAGTARFEPKEDSLYVGRVAVHPEYRRRGVGTALMGELERLAPHLGYSRLFLATRESMPGNLLFYERLGYRIVSREPHPRGPDVIVWFEKTGLV